MESGVPLLIISGPVGVGKTTVGLAISGLLDERGIHHALIDSDYLNRLFPRDADDPFAERLLLQNLQAVSRNYLKAGARYLILTGVVENSRHMHIFKSATGASDVCMVRLRASLPTLTGRLSDRESGDSLEWHVRRAEELSAQLEIDPFEDTVIDTDNRPVLDIANEILQTTRWSRSEA